MAPTGWPELACHPPTSDASIQAWDAADEYVLATLGEDDLPSDPRFLVVNDRHGGITVPLLSPRIGGRPVGVGQITVWSDSVLAMQSIEQNLARNELSAAVEHQASTSELSGIYDVVVIKIPKSLALLDMQLCALADHVTPRTRVIGAAKARHIHTSTIKTFERRLGTTTTSLAKKKARLIHCTPDRTRTEPDVVPRVELRTPAGLTVVNVPGVFAFGKLDVGTRLLLDHLPRPADGADVVDLGCGDGVLGATLAQRFGGGSLLFADASFVALASAEATMAANGLDEDRVRYLAANGLDGVPDGSADLIVNNPPFHDGTRTGDDTAWGMFLDARRVLRPGGELWVVANRHLGHHGRLRTLFGNADVVASNPKFVVLRSMRGGQSVTSTSDAPI